MYTATSFLFSFRGGKKPASIIFVDTVAKISFKQYEAFIIHYTKTNVNINGYGTYHISKTEKGERIKKNNNTKTNFKK